MTKPRHPSHFAAFGVLAAVSRSSINMDYFANAFLSVPSVMQLEIEDAFPDLMRTTSSNSKKSNDSNQKSIDFGFVNQ